MFDFGYRVEHHLPNPSAFVRSDGTASAAGLPDTRQRLQRTSLSY